MHLGRVRARGQKAAQHRLRVEWPRRLQQKPGEVDACDLEIRIELERLAERVLRSHGVSGGAQRTGEDVKGLGVARRRGDGAARDPDGFGVVARVPHEVRQQQLRADIRGIRVEGAAHEPHRLIRLSAVARFDRRPGESARVPSGAAALRHAGEEIPQHCESGPDRAFSR